MDKDICKCGKASAKYDVIGEDEYEVTIIHGTIKRQGFAKVIECKTCHDKFSIFDPFMVKLIDTRIK